MTKKPVLSFIPLQRFFNFQQHRTSAAAATNTSSPRSSSKSWIPWRRDKKQHSTSSTPTSPPPSSPPSMCNLRQVADFASQTVNRANSNTNKSSSTFSVPDISATSTTLTLTQDQLNQLNTLTSKINTTDLGIPTHSQLFLDSYDKHLEPITSNLDQNIVGYIPVCETSDFTMAVFILSPGSFIPLHDHPFMYVSSKVLWGELDICSFDVIDFDNWPHDLCVKQNPIQTVTTGEVKSLTPNLGNIHSFYAKQWTAVFDILIPPYQDEAGRGCTYFEQLPHRYVEGESGDDDGDDGESNDETINSSSNDGSPEEMHQNNEEYQYLKISEDGPNFGTIALPYRGMSIDFNSKK